ncbi:hypothetical protein GCM10022224_041240 [Nonomuraea antimicrobica]|uniref:Uncharacterized protein n=1 Tax=Nonomuraea antimicrobica TaxID=561173 RepID=A0ABP7BZ27_9ACTN
MKFGYRYGSGEPVEDPLRPTGAPGGRAPHVWLERDGERVSTVDLWADGLVLLAGPGDAAWTEAAARLAARDGLPLTAYRLVEGDAPVAGRFLADREKRCAAAFGITGTGAVLIRPDGFIAWRAPETADPDAGRNAGRNAGPDAGPGTGAGAGAVLGEACRRLLATG